jgi:FkbM family methyltransferase
LFDFTRILTLESRLRYRGWQLLGRGFPVKLETLYGERFELRGSPKKTAKCLNNDYGVAWEIFINNVYEEALKLASSRVDYVVDIGSNVGYSIIRWMAAFPNAKILGYEPHPANFCQAVHNIQMNPCFERVELINGGAGSSDRIIYLSDAGASSRIVESNHGINAAIIDVFPRLMTQRIDLMKLDAEGAEYELLADPRMNLLDVRALIMEWHAVCGYSDKDWCYRRLIELGYTVKVLEDVGDHGTLWAIKNQ